MPEFTRQRPDILDQYYEQTAKDKLIRASKENPAMPVALGKAKIGFKLLVLDSNYLKVS